MSDLDYSSRREQVKNITPKHLVIACPHTTGWAVTTVRARTKHERERLAKKMIAELILDEFLSLAESHPQFQLAADSDNDSRREYLLSELFRRAREKDDDGETYIIYVGTLVTELPVPRQNAKRTLREPMDRMIRVLVREIRNILRSYPG